MPITIHTSKSKPKIEFQYGGHPFSETGSSFISAVDWNISWKIGVEIDLNLLKPIPSINLNPEVDFWLHGRHLEKSIWRHNSAADRPITTKFGKQMQNEHADDDTHVEIETGNRIPIWRPSVLRNRNSFTQPWRIGVEIDFHLLKPIPSLNLNPEVHFRLYGRHIENSTWRHYSAADRPITMKFGRQM